MINLGKHHLQRIDAIAAATKETDVDVLARLLMELGPVLSAGQVTAWLHAESVHVGLEKRSDHRDTLADVSAWQAIEGDVDTWPRFDAALLADEEEVGA
jgi:hypothetical protein